METDTEGLVVGAGPTGLTLAIALTLQQTPFVAIDTRAEGTNESRAAVMHGRARLTRSASNSQRVKAVRSRWQTR